MGFSDLWNRTLVYFGIAEEDEWDDEYAVEQELERSYQDRPNRAPWWCPARTRPAPSASTPALL